MSDRFSLLRRTSGALFLAAGLTALAAPAAAAAPPGPVREALDLRYAKGGNSRHVLDVFAPRGAKRAPVVLFVHGGTWMFGDKNFFGLYRGVGRYLARHGAVAVSVNYRLSPAVKHPAHVRDVARAFAWARAHVAEYGGDPDHIILCGHSAGGHLVALLATDETYLKDPALKLTSRDRQAVRGVIGVCGVYRIPGPDEFKEMAGHIVARLVRPENGATRAKALVVPVLLRASLALNPFEMVFGNDRDVQTKASPLAHVRAGLPPFLIIYAEAEAPNLASMANEFTKALRAAGNKAEIRQFGGTRHNSILFNLTDDSPVGKALLDFVERSRCGPGTARP
jgi:acetyl esterase/lipase